MNNCVGDRRRMGSRELNSRRRQLTSKCFPSRARIQNLLFIQIGISTIPPLFSLGTLTVEEVYKDRDQFAALVREVAAPDVGRMGIEILSFTIKDVYDDVQYLQSLGKAQTASVKRDADSGVAEANR